jgi:hypothetical protein
LLILPIRIWVPESEEWEARKAAGHGGERKFERKKPRVSEGQMAPWLFGSILLAAAFGFGSYYGLTGMSPHHAQGRARPGGRHGVGTRSSRCSTWV